MAATPPGALPAHLPALDGVRGLAILLVLAHNFALGAEGPGLLARAFHFAGDIGWVGVQLFFVLSGFLITGILLDTRESPGYYGTFFTRRVLRIFPLYYATLFVAFALLPLVTRHAPDGRHQIWLWTYLANWAAPAGRGVDAFPHFWSLSVEEQFYLLWPLLVRRLSPRGLGRLCLGLVVAALAARIALRAAGMGPDPTYVWTICRMDALAAGALVAIGLRQPAAAAFLDRHHRRIVGAGVALATLGLLLTRGYPRATVPSQTFGYTILAAVCAVLVLAAVHADRRGGRLQRLLRARPLRAAGKYSYGMYVFHAPLHQLLAPRALRWAGGLPHVGLAFELGYLVLATALTCGAAALSYHLFEKRFLALKDRLAPPRLDAPSPA